MVSRGIFQSARAGVVRFFLRVKRLAEQERYALWRSRPVRPNVVFYESFSGNGMLCNPEAIFRALHRNPEFAHLTHIWALDDTTGHELITREFAADPTVRFVTLDSNAYRRALATSGYLVNNATFPPEFGKRPGQIYLNTWHGTPLKRMGIDIGDPATRFANVIRNFLAADYLLAANSFMVSQLYESAHGLKQLFAGRFIVEGYPRVDHQFAAAETVADTIRLIEAGGVTIGDRRVILYAPTWKGTSFTAPRDELEELAGRVSQLTRELNERLGDDRFIVLLKTHQIVHRYIAQLPGLAATLLSNDIPTNKVLAATDLLVTDYSSVFFDFLATGKPIFFLVPDLADYAGYRGLYCEPGEWPGPVVETVTELAAEIESLEARGVSPEIAARQRSMTARFAAKEDGHATERIIDIVFRNKTIGYDIREATRDSRPTVLLNAGQMRPNGITTALLALLDSIDYDRMDVTVVFAESRSARVVSQQRLIDARVRQFSRTGTMNGGALAQARRLRSWKRGDLSSHRTNRSERRLWDDEWVRCFGDSHFDFVVDFSGYGPLWATLLLHAPHAVRSIFLHNEMVADTGRVAADSSNPLADLRGIFSLYRDYDNLVSVSPALSDLNRRTLSRYASAGSFKSVIKPVSAQRIRTQAAGDLTCSARAETTDPSVPKWVSWLDDSDVGTTPRGPVFISIGLLTPEKNIGRLIEAFRLLQETVPAARLLIIGDGSGRPALQALLSAEGLTGVALLAGALENPLPALAHADCFVISSDYDGAPMAVFEALVLGVPVVAVGFTTAQDLLTDGRGLVVASTVEALAAGMLTVAAGEFSATAFDAVSHNTAAMTLFYAAIGMTVQPQSNSSSIPITTESAPNELEHDASMLGE